MDTHEMPAPRRSPEIIYADVIPLWEKVLAGNGGVLRCSTSGQAIALVHRMNRYRKIVRENDEMGFCPHDNFILRTEGLKLVAEKRRPLDVSEFVPNEVEEELDPQEAWKSVTKDLQLETDQ